MFSVLDERCYGRVIGMFAHASKLFLEVQVFKKDNREHKIYDKKNIKQAFEKFNNFFVHLTQTETTTIIDSSDALSKCILFQISGTKPLRFFYTPVTSINEYD